MSAVGGESKEADGRGDVHVIPAHWQAYLRTLQTEANEVGGELAFCGRGHLAAISTFVGEATSVDWPRRTPACAGHFHTHPRDATNARLIYLPPSPFDIVGVMFADAHVDGVNKIGLVVGREGVYCMQVQSIATTTLSLADHCAALQNQLVAYYQCNAKSIFFERDGLQRYLDLALAIAGVRVSYLPWPAAPTESPSADRHMVLPAERPVCMTASPHRDFARRELVSMQWYNADEAPTPVARCALSPLDYWELMWGEPRECLDVRLRLQSRLPDLAVLPALC